MEMKNPGVLRRAVPLEGERDTYVSVSCFQESLELVKGWVMYLPQPGVAPGVLAVEKHNVVAIVQDDIAWLCAYLRIACRERAPQGPYLLEPAIVACGICDGCLSERFHQRPGGGIVLYLDRKGGVAGPGIGCWSVKAYLPVILGIVCIPF